jgi:hypothetical protein
MSSVTKAFDCVRCEKLNGLPVPDWATPEKYEEMGDVLSKRLNFLYASKKAQRLRAGAFNFFYNFSFALKYFNFRFMKIRSDSQ